MVKLWIPENMHLHILSQEVYKVLVPDEDFKVPDIGRDIVVHSWVNVIPSTCDTGYSSQVGSRYYQSTADR